MGQKLVFIHALFRTGSTYLWNTFRRNNKYCCYYEPFNENLINLVHDYFKSFNIDEKVSEKNRHPDLSNTYFYEYKKFIKKKDKGVPYFKKSFPYDEYCRTESNPDLLRYINFLIDGAEEKIPIFQFNRSSLRALWFKRNYPSSLNIYLYRNPRDQWQSYIDFFKRNNNPYFLTRDIMIAGKNRNKDSFSALQSLVPLFEYFNDDFSAEEIFYMILYKSYTDAEQYTVVYFLWLTALIENILNSDFVICIDDLNANIRDRGDFIGYLRMHEITGIDLNDINIRGYSSYSLDPGIMDWIEKTVREVIFSSLGSNKKREFHDKLDSSGNISQLLREKIINPASTPMNVVQGMTHLNPEERHFDMSMSIARNAVDIVNEKKQYINQIYNSYTYKLGDFILNPIKRAIKIYRKIKNR